MASPPVVIDMGIAEPAEVLVASMIEACGKAVPEGGCHLVREAPQGPYRAIAILTWEGTDKVRIEVGLRRDEGTEWRSRSLTFQPRDADIERFRSVGFVVGTLAAEEDREEGPAPITSPPPVVRPPVPAPVPKPRAKVPKGFERDGALGAAGVIGGALDDGGPRFGGAARGRLDITSFLGVVASLGASFRPRDERGLALRFLDAGVGLGVVLYPARPLGWELELVGVIEHFRAEASSGGESDARERVLPVLRAELDAVWAVAPPFEFLLGGNAVARPESTAIVVGGERAGSTGVLELGVTAGARWAF